MPLSARALRTLNLLVLGTALAVGAFHLGQAGAARGEAPRRRTPVVEAVEHAAPAVVSVHADTTTGRRSWRRSAGSGVIVHPSGYVITNSHVIAGGQRVWIELFRDGGRHEAQVVANQPSHDLALLRIQRKGGFPYVSIAATRDLLLGEPAIAIGNPRGLGDTITVGVISALGREAKLTSGVELDDLIQTDASINTGNSGGALLNLDGELLGVIVSLLPESTGIAFAIPGDQVRALLQRALGSAPGSHKVPAREGPAPASQPHGPPPRQVSAHRERSAEPEPGTSGGLPPPLVDGGTRTSGERSRPLRPEDYGMTLRSAGGGVRVASVTPSGPAELAGIHVGDEVLAIDGRSLEGELDIALAFSGARPGRVYHVGIRRGSLEKDAALITPR